jgi:hypothetical protein
VARYQYRIAGPLRWHSSSGNALIALANRLGSGKRITIRSFEILPTTANTSGTAGTASAVAGNRLRIARATVAGGEPLAVTKLDSDAGAFPSTVAIRTGATFSGTTDLRQILASKRMNPGGAFSDLARETMRGRFAGVLPAARRGNSPTTVERIVLRPGEAIAVYPFSYAGGMPVRVDATLKVRGSPDRTFVTSGFVSNPGESAAVFSVANNDGSAIVEVLDLRFEECGIYDSPYFQLVPVGAINADSLDDPVAAAKVLKLDTNYPDPSTWIQAVEDAPLLPFGVPESYLAEGSAGTPKGFNYLKTKDFVGPLYRTLFPEFVAHAAAVRQSDTLGLHLAMRRADILVRRAGITLRPGEGIALVSGAETATIATAIGASGWSTFEFAMTFDVDPISTPTLTLTGLKANTEVRIFNAGTTTELAGIEDVTGSFAWLYDTETVSSVDVSILSLGYQNLRLLALPLGSSDVTVPVQQVLDRQYLNP